MTSASYGASGSFGATWPKKKKKRLPRPKPDAPVTMCWMQSPLLTRIPRPGSARPASASRPPQSLRMTLHYSRARMDAPTPVLDAHVPAHTRPATAGHLRSAGSVRGYGATMFFDATTREPLGGTVELRGRPSTARPDLGGSYNVTDTPRSARWSAHETAAQSEYLYLVEEAEAELAQMMAAERPSVQSARGSKKEEFEHVESLLRRPRKIVERKKREMVEEESDPRKEVLLAYQDMCLRMRMPCQAHLSVEHYEAEKAAGIQRESLRQGGEGEGDTPHEYASPAKIEAMGTALYNTLRKKKKKKPPPEPSWRDKYDENGKSKEDPWWAAPDDPTEDSAWLSKYNP
eukprot:Tamp_15710.p1 GENE.Tamp_15710~~Tamp_15710.p1  ORF type:complete len:360 (+),score=79.92 Tamp_15710:45-1082(+)